MAGWVRDLACAKYRAAKLLLTLLKFITKKAQDVLTSYFLMEYFSSPWETFPAFSN
jgi:hypothetical protein